jgi:hypothetical protein
MAIVSTTFQQRAAWPVGGAPVSGEWPRMVKSLSVTARL